MSDGRSILRSSPLSGFPRSIAESGYRGCFLGGCASKWCGRCSRTINHLNTPLNNPTTLLEEERIDIEVTDPTHPLFGRRFPLRSPSPQRPQAEHVFVAYQEWMVLRIPRAVTNRLPQPPRVSTTLTSHAITELIALAEQCEVLCHTIPEPSGPPSAPHSKPSSAPSS